MKKAIAVFLALVSAWVIFLPFDVPFFIDEAIALVIFTKSMAYLGFDVTRFIPFLKKKSSTKSAPTSAAANDSAIDV